VNDWNGKTYQLGNFINKGKFGKVYHGTEIMTAEGNYSINFNDHVVIKMIKIDKYTEFDCKSPNGQTYTREVYFLNKLKDVYGIVRMIDYFKDDKFIYIVMKPIPNPIDLFQFIRSTPDVHLDNFLSRLLFHKLVKVVRLIYFEYDIVHADLK